MTKSEIIKKIKGMLVERLMLDIDPDEIQNNAPLFDSTSFNNEESEFETLGLDSVDALELVVGIQELFNIKINTENNSEIFYSVDTLAEYVIKILNKE